MLALAVAALVAACDQGKQHNEDTAGRQITVTSANVGGKNPKLPANGSIQIGFDRLLNPISVTRQSVQVRDGAGQAIDPSPLIEYDPVARVVTVSDPGTVPGKPWLTPDVPYTVRLIVPANGADDVGLRAIDRATLNPDDPSREIAFFTTTATAASPKAPQTKFCNDVLPIFQKCTGSQCHSSPGKTGPLPAAGLILDFSAGVANTAIARVANGSNTGPLSGASSAPGRLFGVDMPLIDPFSPGNSWLLYKVLLATPTIPAKFQPAVRMKCDGTTSTQPVVQVKTLQSTVMDDTERGILSDYVLGREMPYPYYSATGPLDSQGLTFEELERVRLWIAQGAVVDECGACER